MPGTAVIAIPTQAAPSKTTTVTQLESPRNVGDNFGARIRGYLCPPQSGNYTFRLSGDDNCELWLSPDDNPANKVKIAGFVGFTDYGQWSKYATQQSAPVALQAGRRYYVEALHKEGGGGDFVAVSWQLPNGQTEAPIPGTRLIPFATTASRTAPATASSPSTTEAAPEARAAELSQPSLQIYPNPFTEQTRVEISVPTAGSAKVLVYDAQNRLVRQLFDGSVAAGERKEFALSGEGLPNGFYVVRLVLPGRVVTQKLSVVR